MLVFKTFHNAWRVIIGIKLLQKIHKLQFAIRGLSRNGVKNYSKGPCVTILE